MADSPNTPAPQSNIDDLVKELSRPQGGISSAPTQPAMGGSVSRPAMPPPVQSAPMPQPSVPPSTPRPNPVSVPPAKPVSPAPPKEYQSSIRTMSDDLTKLKAGQAPQGVNIPRKIVNVPPPVPVKPPQAIVPPVPAARQQVNTMPEAIPGKKLPSMPAPAPAPVPPVIPRPAPPPSVMAPAAKAPAIKPESKSQFYVPPATTAATSGGGGSRSAVFIGIALVAVILGGLYWYFMIYSSSPEEAIESPIATFTPRPTATPNPDMLGTIFTVRGGTIVLPQSGDPTSAFNAALAAQPGVTGGAFTVIDVVGGVASASPQPLSITGLLDRFAAPYPPEIKTALGENFKILLYGQREAFDTKGRPIVDAPVSRRLTIVSEIANSSLPILLSWETTMASNLAKLMGITATKNTAPFLATDYHGASVRFKNFIYPDHSIDYTILPFNGKNYIIFSNSRESTFAAIDAFITTVGQ